MEQASPPPSNTTIEQPGSRNKSRRLSQVDEGNILESRKRKRGQGDEEGGRRAGSPNPAILPAKTPEEFEQVRQTAMILYDKLMAQRDPNDPNRFLYHAFSELPDPELYPHYYDKIKKPICFSQIKEKLDNHSYNCLLDAKTDMNQIFVNAKRFNARESSIFLDAKKLHKNLRANYAFLTGEAPPPEEEEVSAPRNARRGSSTVPPGDFGGGDDGDYVQAGGNGGGKRGPTLKPWLLKKFDQLVHKKDPHGRTYADAFRVLPDKREWADYYQFIQNPISLDNIFSKTNQRRYRTVDQWRQDVETCFGNAMFYNEENSVIWQDANIMLGHLADIMREKPPNFAPPRKYNTAKRRAQAENAQSEPDRGMSVQPNEDEKDDMSQGDYETGEDSDAGGDYSGLAENGFDSPQLQTFNNPFASVGLESPGLATLPSQGANNALDSLATLAASLSPQRPTQPLPATNGASYHAPRLASASFTPKPLSKIPSLGEVPLITEFTVSTTPASRPIVLANLQSRQHSLAVPPSTTQIEFTASYRRQRRDGSIVFPSSSSLSNSNGANQFAQEEEGLPVNPVVSTSSRPDTALSRNNEKNEGGRSQDSPKDFIFIPKKGLNMAEFTLTPKGKGQTEPEVYRIFITK